MSPASYDLICPNGHRTHCRCKWDDRFRAIEIANNLIAVCGLICRECEEEIVAVEEVPQV